ncbi:MAG: phosphoribosylglycinamide formyltransferase [Luteibacter sp.]|uniref:phosphoribosylglycinamide formyltransferase n=1 Tax=Luteibacter sp. TaxID=1886636 RepID=UPI0028090E55|nr:phosphoribosylglycinamide formyltransferase [Luteibacter sp.]MDQ7997593.1 phosphoribosylglycinamide formyltransferase [Luteibacter sp.]MDQ8047884.1 phosphoribosylglycinamide formyltransferase [Luteibacter sp.]
MDRPLRVAALASGRGSNLAALIAARLPVEFVLVGSDKARAGALTVAAQAGIPTVSLHPGDFATRADFDRALFGHVAASGADLLVLAGYMRIVDADVVAAWEGRAINVHPSLLPKYRGLHTHRQCLEAGDAEHGASVHFVTAELDGGPVVAQARIPVLPGDTEISLAERLLVEEHKLLPAVVAAIASGRLRWEGGAIFDGLPLTSPLRLTDL